MNLEIRTRVRDTEIHCPACRAARHGGHLGQRAHTLHDVRRVGRPARQQGTRQGARPDQRPHPMTTKGPTTVQVDTQSMVAVDGVPGIHGDFEWFIPLPGRGQRRTVRPGDHVPVGHELTAIWPDRFAPSAEPPDCWPIKVELEEVRQERERQRVHLTPHNTRAITPCCLRCGATSTHTVVMVDTPNALDLISALSGLDDSDYRGRMQIEAKFAAAVRDSQARAEELRLAEQAWRSEHQACPYGTPPLPEPDVPEQVPLTWRLPSVRTLS
jgi:hypothetical protein